MSSVLVAPWDVGHERTIEVIKVATGAFGVPYTYLVVDKIRPTARTGDVITFEVQRSGTVLALLDIDQLVADFYVELAEVETTITFSYTKNMATGQLQEVVGAAAVRSHLAETVRTANSTSPWSSAIEALNDQVITKSLMSLATDMYHVLDARPVAVGNQTSIRSEFPTPIGNVQLPAIFSLSTQKASGQCLQTSVEITPAAETLTDLLLTDLLLTEQGLVAGQQPDLIQLQLDAFEIRTRIEYFTDPTSQFLKSVRHEEVFINHELPTIGIRTTTQITDITGQKT